MTMIPDWLSLVDICFLLVAIMFAWGGAQRGFAGQLAHVITFIFAGLLLFFAYPALFSYFGRIFRSLEETYLMWMILITLLIFAIALFLLVSKLLAGLLKMQLTDRADQGWGIVFGFFRGLLFALIGMILLVMLDRTGGTYDRFRVKSQVGKLVCYEIVPRIQPRLTALYENKINDWKSEMLRREEAAGDVEI